MSKMNREGTPLMEPTAPPFDPSGATTATPAGGMESAMFSALSPGAAAPIQPGTGNERRLLPLGRGPTPGVTCAMLQTPDGRAFQVQSMTVAVEVHISVAFVTVDAVYVSPVDRTPAVLKVPMNQYGVVTHCSMVLGSSDRLIETTVVDPEALEGVKKKEGQEQYSSYNPHLFQLPIPEVHRKDPVSLKLTYFEPLEFRNGNYRLVVPLVIPGPTPITPNITCTINTGTTASQWGSTSHAMIVSNQQGPTRTECYADTRYPRNTDFEITYMAWSPHIVGTCLFEAAGPGYDPRGSFLMFLSPPQMEANTPMFRRDVVFLLDHSGSMHGQPLESAKAALCYSLQQLRPGDFFSICAFDHTQTWYLSGNMTQVNPSSVDQAITWVRGIQCAGGTDIMNPVSRALEILAPAADSGGVPFVFLLTDGAVSNERDICHMVHRSKSAARICTFGIGTYCNSYFLKMLATTGRGFSDVAYFPDQMQDQIVRFFELAQSPAMTNIQLGLNAVDGVEMYPYPIPDLFCGAPLVVSGKFKGNFTNSVPVRGHTPQHGFVEMQVAAAASKFIPLHKVFAKQRLDLLTAKAWLEDSTEIKNQVIQLSVAENMPSAHAPLVAYETTKEKKKTSDKEKAKNNGKMSKGTIAAVAVGGILVVGAAAVAFGDVGATLANASTLDALTDFGGLDVFGALGDLGGAIGDFAGDAAGAIGDVAGDAAGAIGDVASGAGGAIGDAAGAVGDAAGDCCGDCGDCGNLAGDACAGAGDCLGGLCDVLGEVGSCAGEVLGAIFSALD